MEILEDAHARISSVFSYFPGVQQKQPIGDHSVDANYDRTFETAPRIELKGEPIGKPFARLFFEKRRQNMKSSQFPKAIDSIEWSSSKINNLLRQIESLVHRAFQFFLFYPICKFLSHKLLNYLERRFSELLPLGDGVNVTRLYSAGRGNCVRPKKAYLHPQCQYCAPQSKRHIHK